jgi:ATP-binding cassette subfamily A (ABC1) protein 3
LFTSSSNNADADRLFDFFQLKGCPFADVPAEVDRMIQVLHLEDKKKVATSKLSGGMKRKLSVGIALIAGSKVIHRNTSR